MITTYLSCVIVAAAIGDVATAARQPTYLLAAIHGRGWVGPPGLPNAEMSCPIRLCANFDHNVIRSAGVKGGDETTSCHTGLFTVND